MVMKILGVIDILNAIIAVFAAYAPKFAIYLVILLFLKGLIFALMGDVGSWFDMAAAVIIFLAISQILVLTPLLKFIAILLVAKGISSMV